MARLSLENNPAQNFSWLARLEMIRQFSNPIDWAIANEAPSVVQRILQRGLTGTTEDSNWAGAIADVQNVVTSFADSLRTRGIFFPIFNEGGFRRVPMRQRFGFAVSNATAWIAQEGAAVPLTNIVLDADHLEPTRAAALLVTTDEVARNISATGRAFLERELRGAVSRVTDEKFLQIISSGAPTLSSSGADVAAILFDLRAMLSGIETHADARLFWLASTDVAKGLATAVGDDALVFPQMTPLGGQLCGVDCLVSDALSSGTLALIDAAAVATDLDTIELRSTRQADLEISATPSHNSTTPTPAQLVSLFQSNGVALLLQVRFAAQRFRSNSLVFLQGLDFAVPTL